MAQIQLVFSGSEVRNLFKEGEKGYVICELQTDPRTGDPVEGSISLKSYVTKDIKVTPSTQFNPGSFSNGCPTPPCVPNGGASFTADCSQKINDALKKVDVIEFV